MRFSVHLRPDGAPCDLAALWCRRSQPVDTGQASGAARAPGSPHGRLQPPLAGHLLYGLLRPASRHIAAMTPGRGSASFSARSLAARIPLRSIACPNTRLEWSRWAHGAGQRHPERVDGRGALPRPGSAACWHRQRQRAQDPSPR
jgi:hypothetical protein